MNGVSNTNRAGRCVTAVLPLESWYIFVVLSTGFETVEFSGIELIGICTCAICIRHGHTVDMVSMLTLLPCRMVFCVTED
jgi:hypothetical protein